MEPEEAANLLIEEYGRMATAYDAHVVPLHLPVARRLLELAQLEKGETVLDIGCGTGVAAFEAAIAVGVDGSVTAVDLAHGVIRLARKKAAAQNLRHLKFEVRDVRGLGFPEESYDAVVSCFGHPLVGRGRCFVEAHRVLRRGGRFVLSTWDPTKMCGVPFREILERHRPHVLPPDVARLIEARKVISGTEEGKDAQSVEGWVRLLRVAGFSTVQVIEEVHRARFRDADAYLDYSFAWGDNDRELRHMKPEDRESMRAEFRDRVRGQVTEEGFIVDWPIRYFVVRRG